MAIGIYKPGQGYWVRVLTAVAGGLLVLATAAWLWQETTLINLPATAWDVSVTGASGAPTPGETVTVLDANADLELVEIGTMTVADYRASEFQPVVRLEGPQLSPGKHPNDIDAIRSAGFEAAVGESGAIRPIPVVDPLYLQGGVAGVVLLLGAGLIFWLTAAKPSSCEFLIATDGEMKKVNWSTRREVMGSTWIVIVASVILAGILYGVDFAFQTFFTAIDVLQR